MDNERAGEEVLNVFDSVLSAYIQELLFVIPSLLLWLSIFIYLIYQAGRGKKIGLPGSDKIFYGMLGSLVISLISFMILFIVEDGVEEVTYSLLSSAAELISVLFLMYAAWGFKVLVINYKSKAH